MKEENGQNSNITALNNQSNPLNQKEKELLESIKHPAANTPSSVKAQEITEATSLKSKWSFYEKTPTQNSSDIFNTEGKLLEPLKFSNGKTQQDVVEETMQAIKEGHKIIFIHGVCGTGKSSIALNIAKNFKKTSIVVPIKSLQEQYEADYSQKKFILKDDGKPLDISVIKGRANFECPFDCCRASEKNLPCAIEIREKNAPQIFEYLEKNPEVNKEDFENITDIRRINIAPTCPYWSPILPSKTKSRILENATKTSFDTISGKEFSLFERSPNCKYFMQYKNYSKSDVLIFNSMKYLIETAIGRKPLTDLEIIDECDEFLDSFSTEKRINVNRLVSALGALHPEDPEKKVAVKDLIHKLNSLLFEPEHDVDCEKLENTEIQDIIAIILENPNLAEDEELNYYNNALEIARGFESLLYETYVSTERIKPDEEQAGLFGKNYSKDERVIISLVTINLAEQFKELVSKNKQLILMSGTLHSAEVLRDIFGIKDFKVIQAEEHMPGKIKPVRSGLEKNCAFANFRDGTITRDQYLKILDHGLSLATRPTLVHINAFSDLPSEIELDRLKLHNLISKEKLRELQQNHNEQVESFLSGKKDILFTTKCARGVDFAGELCNSIVLTKFPYPNISSLFWKILRKEQPQKFREFYVDKAQRELIQKIARGIRFRGDKVELLSPDVRVLNAKLE
jgi:Rad3-related DNA helicase